MAGGRETDGGTKGLAALPLRLRPGTLTRDAGPQGVARASCPSSGTRRELSIDMSYNRGCPHKQNNPVQDNSWQLEEEPH